MNTQTMKAMVASAYGSGEVLALQEVPKPEIGPQEILVKVYASAATRADQMMLSGKPFFTRLFLGLRKPKHDIPGTGFAGKVEAIGSEVLDFAIGDRVFGETLFGFSANAEYVKVEKEGVILPMPDGMNFAEASTFCDGHMTSINFLKELADIKAGQKVLINGASGSLGTAAVQLAKYYGAIVTGVCSTRNIGLVKSLGADHVIDYTRQNFSKMNNSYDIIYDTIGRSSYAQCKSILTAQGQYISPVLNMPLLFQMIWTSLFSSKKAKFTASGMKKADEIRTLLHELIAIFKEGKIKTIIDRQYPLEKLGEAHRYIATGRKKGNVVITNYHQ